MSLSSFWNEEPARIANVFIDLAALDGRVLSNMKLQKLVYISFGFYSAFADEPLFEDDIQAWNYGPVIPSLYQRLKKYGPGRVDEKLSVLQNIQPGTLKYSVAEAVWKRYKHLSATQLSALTHQEDSPWGQVWKKGHKNLVIPFETIRDYYKTKLTPQNG